MEVVIGEALKYGLGGVIVAGLLTLLTLMVPSVKSVLPGVFARRAKREDRVIAALERHIEVSTSVIAALQALTALVADVREESAEVRIDVQYIAERLDLRPLPSRVKRGKGDKLEQTGAAAR